jgi:NDP-sugar pyrophosphorylase family protein
MSKLTVIMPAAGEGTRLNLPYPKEILRLDKEQALIDYSFDFFRDYGRKDVEFVVIVNESKTEIVEYLAKYKDRYNISFTYQNPHEFEYTGAIKSAKHLFGEHNVILLPDTIMKLPANIDLVTAVEESLTETGFTFFYKEETNPDMLKTKGAINIDANGKVVMYEDKPESNHERFNAFWCSFAFRRRAFDECIAFMEKSTLKQRVNVDEIKGTPIFQSKGIKVDDYTDLGTWPEIRKLIAEHDQ